MTNEDPVNRMADRPDLEHLRETSVHPSWWARNWDKFLLTLRSRTTITIVLALTIVVAIVVGLWALS